MKVNEKLSVLFLLENAKKTKFGLVPLTVRLTIDGLRTELSLGKKVFPEFWDQDRSQVILKGNRNLKQAQSVNSAIVQCLAELVRQYLILNEKCEPVSVELLKKSYNRAIGRKNPETENQESKEKTLCQVCNYKYSKFSVLVKNGHRSANTLKRWRSTKRKIREFLKFKFNKWDIPLSTMRYSHANDFLHFLLTKHRIEENTSRKYLKNTKELLQIAEDQQWIPKNLWNNYKIGYDQPERECLSLHEIIRLHEKPLIERLDHVRNIFLFACFTGYAFQEVLSLTPEDIFIGIDGKNWIKIDRKKTGRPECIPLLPIPASIVSRYANDPYCLSNHKLLPLKSYQNYNGYLKEVAYICELKINLSTHIARHTFATTICLDHDVPIETVSRMLGHTNIRTTQIYAKVSRKKISNNMNELEKKIFSPDGELMAGLFGHALYPKPILAVK